MNRSELSRRLSVALAVEWALDVDRVESQLHVETSVDPTSGALMVSNSYHRDRPNQYAFLQVLADERSLSGSRKSFLGRNGCWASPAALNEEQLDNLVGKGLDSLGAIQTRVTLEPEQETTVVFFLGISPYEADCRRLLKELDF